MFVHQRGLAAYSARSTCQQRDSEATEKDHEQLRKVQLKQKFNYIVVRLTLQQANFGKFDLDSKLKELHKNAKMHSNGI